MSAPFLVDYLKGNRSGRFPVWMMRQAGRYLTSYLDVRKQSSFWEMVMTPELASRVTLLPLEVLDVDALILFSDILTLPKGLGVEIEMKEALGPVVTRPFQQQDDFRVFRDFHPKMHTAFVSEALRLVAAKKPEDKTLIGFAGAPWTVSCYLIEGTPKGKFDRILRWMYRDPKTLANGLQMLAESTASYLESQVEAGAEVLQLFDTWLSEMPESFFVSHYQPILSSLFEKTRSLGVPLIYFARHAHHLVDHFSRLPLDVLGVDNLCSLEKVSTKVPDGIALQGNLDPMVLFGSERLVRESTVALREGARRTGRKVILNLGHGVLPQTPIENVRAFVEEARMAWPQGNNA